MLMLVKAIHTAIWCVMTAAVAYIGYSVFRMSFNTLSYVALGLILVEMFVLLVNSWTCPLTNVARRYSRDTSYNFDIYLPRFVAQYNKEIFSVILALILFVYIYRII